MLPASVIVVNYASEPLVLDLLARLTATEAERPEQIVVVDNSPAGGLGGALAARDLPVDYAPAPRNLGFAGGVNLGLSETDRAVVILLNPDTLPEARCLAGMVELLDVRPDAGIVGPALVPMDPAVPPQPSATRVDPSVGTALLEHTILRRVASGWLDRNYFLLPDDLERPRDCAMVQGACMAIRRRVASEVGGFDDGRFFHGWEETDFCRRARGAGWKVLYAPALRCRHLGGGSTPDAAFARRWFWGGLLAYHRKHGGAARALVLRALLVPGIAAEWALLALRRAARRRDPRLEGDLEEMRGRLAELVRPERVP